MRLFVVGNAMYGSAIRLPGRLRRIRARRRLTVVDDERVVRADHLEPGRVPDDGLISRRRVLDVEVWRAACWDCHCDGSYV